MTFMLCRIAASSRHLIFNHHQHGSRPPTWRFNSGEETFLPPDRRKSFVGSFSRQVKRHARLHTRHTSLTVMAVGVSAMSSDPKMANQGSNRSSQELSRRLRLSAGELTIFTKLQHGRDNSVFLAA
jgi:hypothetical protein